MALKDYIGDGKVVCDACRLNLAAQATAAVSILADGRTTAVDRSTAYDVLARAAQTMILPGPPRGAA